MKLLEFNYERMNGESLDDFWKRVRAYVEEQKVKNEWESTAIMHFGHRRLPSSSNYYFEVWGRGKNGVNE